MPPIRFPQKRAHSAPPAGFLNTNSRVRRLYQQLQERNARGDIVTYNVSTDSWEPWTRPVRMFRSGAMTEVAASGFRNLPNYEPPVCPHASDLARDVNYSKMELHLRRKYQGRVVDFFQVPKSSHFCPFVVVIPPLNPPMVLYTQDEIEEQLCEYETGSKNGSQIRFIELQQ